MNLQSKRGSYTVFITIAFSGILLMIAAVLWTAGQRAIGSTTENFGRLWGRSILSEYDINLKDRYGFFGYYGDEFLVEKKLDYYADYTFGCKDYIDFGGTTCMLDGYNLTEQDIFLSQIKEIVLEQTTARPLQKSQNVTPSHDSENRKITSQWIINSLPSGGKGGGIGILSLTKRIKDGITPSSILSETAEIVYIFRFFKDYMNNRDLGETYFSNEIEYIISGKPDDEKARKSVYNDLIILRNSLNLAYLYTCDSKRSAALAAAEAITPGPAAAITQGLIMETWAYIEARNDLKALYDGDPVPLLKRDENWAITLENVLLSLFKIEEDGQVTVNSIDIEDNQKNENAGYVKPTKVEGIEYADYLKLLLAAVPENTKTLRMMDLIQINMKYLYCDYFLIKDYYAGLKFSIEVNGKNHEFEEEY